MNLKVLEKVGLTENEAKVYVCLQENGSALAGQIAETTGVHRRNVYDALERLIGKGLVSYVNIENRRWFSPVNPNRFLEIIEERKAELDKNKTELKKLLPFLLQLRKERPKQDLRFFRGLEGLKTAFEDILRTNQDYLGYGPGEDIESQLGTYLSQYSRKRVRSGIHYRLVYEEGFRAKYQRRWGKVSYGQARYLPDEFISNTAQRIYGEKVAILLLTEKDPFAIIILNKAIADNYRKHFNILWGIAKK